MATKMTTATPRQVSRPFYVYDAAVVKELGGVEVKPAGDDRMVMMTDSQAQYFIDQGTIGAKPLGKLSAKTRTDLHHMTGGGVPKEAEKAQARRDEPAVSRGKDKGGLE